MLYQPPILFPQQTPLKCNQCREHDAVAYDTHEFYVYCQECLELPKEKGPLILGILVYFKNSKHQVA